MATAKTPGGGSATHADGTVERLMQDPDLDVLPAERCSCRWQRLTVMRCSRCGRPACFHCLKPPGAGGLCPACLPPNEDWRARLGHAANALFAAGVAGALAWFMAAQFFPALPELVRSLALRLVAR